MRGAFASNLPLVFFVVLLFCVAILSTVLVRPAAAGSMKWRYDARLGYRPDETSPPWEMLIEGDTLLLRDRLIISTAAPKQNVIYRHSQLAAFPETLVVRFRMRLISGAASNPSAAASAHVAFARGRIGCLLLIGEDEIFLRAPGYQRGEHARVSTMDAMHTYRIESWEDNVRVYHDSALALTGPANYHGVFQPTLNIRWGEGDPLAYGVSEWEFIEHNAEIQHPELNAPLPPFTRSLVELRTMYHQPSWHRWEVPEPAFAHETPAGSRVFVDPFEGKLHASWRWLQENPPTWSSTSTRLALALERGNPMQSKAGPARNLLLHPVESDDFILETTIEAYLAANLNQAHLMIYRDDENFALLGLMRASRDPLSITHVQVAAGTLRRQIIIPCDTARVHLRMLKKNKQVQFQYSFNERDWVLHDQIDDLFFEPTHVGVTAFDGSDLPSASYVFYDRVEMRELEPNAWNTSPAKNPDEGSPE